MTPSSVSCTKCRGILPESVFNTAGFEQCPSCNSLLQVTTFSALLRSFGASALEASIAEGETACFYHQQKRAVVLCDACGRFLCALCDVDFGGQHLCPVCLEVGKKKGRIKNLQNHRILYHQTALSLAILPLLVFWLTLFTAPVVIYLVIRFWNAPGSITGQRTKPHLVGAGLVALAEITGWIFAFYYLATR